jgi:hypothetical protein
LHNYSDVWNELPHASASGIQDTGTSQYRGFRSWAVAIFPFMEQEPIYNQLTFDINQNFDPTADPKTNVNVLNGIVISNLYCPSNSRGKMRSDTVGGTTYKFQKINYVGISGTLRNPNNVTSDIIPNYIHGNNYGKRTFNGSIISIGTQEGTTTSGTAGTFSIETIGLEALSDGTSNTIGITEQSRLVKNSSGALNDWGSSGHRGGGWSGNVTHPNNAGWSANVTTVFWSINATCTGAASNAKCDQPYAANTIITSSHTNGAQFTIMDGSVRFITETVDLNNILLRLAARNDGLPVSLP